MEKCTDMSASVFMCSEVRNGRVFTIFVCTNIKLPLVCDIMRIQDRVDKINIK